MRLAATKNEVTEILIVRHEDSSFAHSSDQDIRIVGLRHRFGHGDDVVTDATQVFTTIPLDSSTMKSTVAAGYA
jgi:hypothetical protein